jgi:predicted RNase H-like nuclease (RuvC/YqgF family)
MADKLRRPNRNKHGADGSEQGGDHGSEQDPLGEPGPRPGHALNGQQQSNTEPPPATHMTPVLLDNANISLQLMKLNDNMTNLNTTIDEMRNENKTALGKHEAKLDKKMEKLEKLFTTKFAHYDRSLTACKTTSDNNNMVIDELRETINNQQRTIDELKQSFEEHATKTTQELLELLKLTNNIEGHQRRWSIRIMGLAAPTTQ